MAETIVAIPNKVSSLDPRTAAIAQERFMLPLIFESLFTLSEDGEIRSQLAKTWDFNPETKVFEVELGSSHVFSDGTKLDAKNVVESFQRYCGPVSSASTLLSSSGVCETAPISDEANAYKVKFKIKINPNDFLFRLGSGRVPVFKLGSSGLPIGSAQYRLDKITTQSVFLKPNDFFPGSKNLANLQFKHVQESDLQIALTKHEVDIATMYLGSTVRGLSLGDYKVISYSPVITQTLVLNDSVKPFDSMEFRKAFYHAIGRNKEFLRCKPGIVLPDGIIPVGIGGSLSNVENSSQALPFAKTKFKMTKSPISFVRHPSRRNHCEEAVIINEGKKLGINISFRYIDDYPELMKIYSTKSADGYLELNVFARDASLILSRLIPGAKNPMFYYTDSKSAEILDHASHENSLRSRFKYYREISELIRQRASVIPIYYESHTNIVRGCIYEGQSDLKTNPNSFLFLLSLPDLDKCRKTK